MSRVKITVPGGPPLFTAHLALRITDMNYGGHMGNEVALVLAHEARVQWLRSLGYTEMDCGGASLIMADAAVVYQSEGRAGDAMKIELFATEATGRSFALVYRAAVSRPEGQESPLFLAKTGMVAFDYSAGKLSRFHPGFLNILQDHKQ